jgi:hypothetical protein
MPRSSARDVVREELLMLQNTETKALEPYVREIIKQFNQGLEAVEDLLKESAKKPGSRGFEVSDDPVTVLYIRDNLQRLRTMLLNSGAFTAGLWHGPVDGKPGHFTIIARAVGRGGAPVLGRRHRIPDEEVEKLWLGGVRTVKCPMPGCNAEAQLVVRAGSPVAFTFYNVINAFVKYLDREVIPKLASGTPISEWLDLVKYGSGAVTKIKLWRAIKMSLDRHGEVRINSIEALAGLRPVMYCPVCGLVDETPGSHGNKCPRCAREGKEVPLVGVAVSKVNVARLYNTIVRRVGGGEVVEVARFDKIEPVEWSSFVRHVRGRTEVQRDMYVIVNQFYKPSKPGAYTVLIIQNMLDMLELPSERIVNALKKTEGGGTGILFRLVWRDVAKLLLDHAAIVAGIVLGKFRGLPPTVQRAISEGHGFIPPLVDVEPKKALEVGSIAKVAKWFEAHYKIDIAKSWEEYQWLRDAKFGDLLAELRARIYKVVVEEKARRLLRELERGGEEGEDEGGEGEEGGDGGS